MGDERQVSQGSKKTPYQLAVSVLSTQCTFYQVSENRRVQGANNSDTSSAKYEKRNTTVINNTV